MKNSLLSRISAFIHAKSLIRVGSTVIIGLSGGPDSVFLAHILADLRRSLGITVIAAHLDHGWRLESSKDALFCQELALQWGIPFITKKIEDLEKSFKFNGSQEEIGRKARRFFFESIAQEYGARTIALAHHADDQKETFFVRLMRGSSLAGLAGMKPKEGLYIRPLLEIKKEEILEYLHQNNIPYLMDASNQSDIYLRNRIRNHIIPALQKADSRFDQNFATTHMQLQKTEEFLQQLTIKTFAEISNSQHKIYIEQLLSLHEVLRNRILIAWLITHKVPFIPSQGLLNEIVRFVSIKKSGKHIFYGKWVMQISKGKVSINNL